jgi:hypothetical protein
MAGTPPRIGAIRISDRQRAVRPIEILPGAPALVPLPGVTTPEVVGAPGVAPPEVEGIPAVVLLMLEGVPGVTPFEVEGVPGVGPTDVDGTPGVVPLEVSGAPGVPAGILVVEPLVVEPVVVEPLVLVVVVVAELPFGGRTTGANPWRSLSTSSEHGAVESVLNVAPVHRLLIRSFSTLGTSLCAIAEIETRHDQIEGTKARRQIVFIGTSFARSESAMVGTTGTANLLCSTRQKKRAPRPDLTKMPRR